MRRILLVVLAAAVCALGAGGATHAAIRGLDAATHKKSRKHKPAPKKIVHGLRAPGLLTPANGAHVEQLPPLTWSAVSGATQYEYQVAASANFNSIVLGKGIGTGTSTTYNLAAALAKPVPDGTYYWRVRGLTASKEHGPWSTTRRLVKAWSAAPQLLRPANGAGIVWPSVPLVLEWTPAPGATEYVVTIASDPGLSNIVLGSATAPTKTSGAVFALPGTLASGDTYYWAITPVDVGGHRGTRSAVREFTWSWPTTTTPSVNPLNAELGESPFTPEATLKWTPEFTWNPVPGAARYEVEVNSAESFPSGSTWYKGTTIGTAASPVLALNNNGYYWRVRAIDANGNAGVWNEGPRFIKAFDNETPTIHNLRMIDLRGNGVSEAPTKGPAVVTGTPIVTWSPVPGAASYEVDIEKLGKETCKTSTEVAATPAWTPLAQGGHIGQQNWPSTQSGMTLEPGETYGVQVAARSDVDAFGHQIESAPTPHDCGPFQFKYEPRAYRCTNALALEAEGKVAQAEEIYNANAGTEHPAYERLDREECIDETGPPAYVPSSGYLVPMRGSLSTHTPLLTWEAVPQARCYYVAISRNPEFTNVADVAETYGTAYAPPVGGEEPLDDETTTYYWAVYPVIPKSATSKTCEGPHLANGPEGEEIYSAFNKSSVPPTPLSPAAGVDVSAQPAFKWTPAEGALNYTLEVSASPTFGTPLETVKTDSTSYTSASTYPANATLYWRVRANDANKSSEHDGLNWSPVQTFTRTLPVPAPAASTTEGQGLPLRAWSAVEGATAYEVHVELPAGTIKNYTLDSTTFTPTELFGSGIWHWQVRALFPGTGKVASGYSAPQPFVHELAPPPGAAGVKAGSRIVISWDPDQYAKEYEVQMSTSDTFSSTIESRRVDEAGWAPNVNLAAKANKGTLYWRVAAVDGAGNIGSFATGSFVPPKPKCVVKKVVKKVKGKKKTVKECVVPKHAKKKTKKK